MLIHLENGCAINKDELYQIASECYQSRYYVNDDWIKILQDGDFSYLRPGADEKPFYCSECEINFSTLSGLVQHVESRRCPQSTSTGPIERMLHYIHKMLW